MSRDGTFIRAFIEADTVRIFNTEKKMGSYPGYAAADRTRNHAGGYWEPAIGYSIHWIVEFTVLPDGAVTALVCSGGSITPDGRVSEELLHDTLQYQRPGVPPPANQHGPARAPNTSVFGDWYATDLSPPVPKTKESIQPCRSTMPNINAQHAVNSPGWPIAVGTI